jgi:hypothetical protein
MERGGIGFIDYILRAEPTLRSLHNMRTFDLRCRAGNIAEAFEPLRLCFPAWKCLRRLELCERNPRQSFVDPRSVYPLMRLLNSVVAVEGGGVLRRRLVGRALDSCWEVEGGVGVLCWNKNSEPTGGWAK